MVDESTAQAVFDHAGLSVSDMDVSRKFYEDVFGFTILEDDFMIRGDIHGLVLSTPNGVRLELFHRKDSDPPSSADAVTPAPAESPRSQGWFQFALTVPDLAASYAAVVAAGAKPIMTPRSAPDGINQVGFVCDPDGNLVELLERPTPDAG
jgi:catechol 2,3-dioxygenase-like lactoylglutathione lyase family enzyme